MEAVRWSQKGVMNGWIFDELARSRLGKYHFWVWNQSGPVLPTMTFQVSEDLFEHLAGFEIKYFRCIWVCTFQRISRNAWRRTPVWCQKPLFTGVDCSRLVRITKIWSSKIEAGVSSRHMQQVGDVEWESVRNGVEHKLGETLNNEYKCKEHERQIWKPVINRWQKHFPGK